MTFEPMKNIKSGLLRFWSRTLGAISTRQCMLASSAILLKHRVIKSCRNVTDLLRSPTHVKAWSQFQDLPQVGHSCRLGVAIGRFCRKRSEIAICKLVSVYSSSVGSTTWPSPAFALQIITARSRWGNVGN
eukprot:Lithocolla_globosa_v1_NODE_309_length_4559_cov_14.810169.p4 type:complete len:131 gc:universal NODE_309_length_4559_cov_14.810169:3977-3585(-)